MIEHDLVYGRPREFCIGDVSRVLRSAAVGDVPVGVEVVFPWQKDAAHLIEMLQSEYVGMYGEPDPNPEGGLEHAVHPHGGTVLVTRLSPYLPVAVGGWTRYVQPDAPRAQSPDTTAVLRRMYVHYAHRGLGLSRVLLEAIERDARQQGITSMLLETGTAQTNALALYHSSGYTPARPFGYYADAPDSVFLGKVL